MLRKSVVLAVSIWASLLYGCSGPAKFAFEDGCGGETKFQWDSGILTPSMKQTITSLKSTNTKGEKCNYLVADPAAQPGALGALTSAVIELGGAAIATQYPTSSFDVDVTGTATGTGGTGGSAMSKAEGGNARATQHQDQHQRRKVQRPKQNHGWQ